jgi:CPA2 family monovalent cation:H+ antiporter-2
MPPLPLLAGPALPFLTDVVALFAVCVVLTYICHRLGLVPIVGFLLAGVALGPSALGLVDDEALINGMAEIGVILLLFTIGIEFSLATLAKIARFIVIGGGVQVSVTIALVVALLMPFGIDLGPAIFTGCLVALSSTAIVLTLLADRSETSTPQGRLMLAILIFQDLAIVAMVLALPILSGQAASPLEALWTLLEAVGIIALVLVAARIVLPPLLDRMAQTRRSELFLLTVVLIGLGVAWLTSLANVSLALGAFLAGLVVSESRYGHQALAEILPLRTVFNVIFFVSVGLLLDLGFVLSNLPLVLGVAAGVLVMKALITGASVALLGYPIRIVAAVGLGLAQIGEFSFVLAKAGEDFDLTPLGLGDEGTQAFIAVTVVLMLLTPGLMAGGPRLGTRLSRTALRKLGSGPIQEVETAGHDEEDHVVVVGYGPAGRRLVQVLRDTGIPYVVIELNPRSVKEAEADDVPIVYGDASHGALLDHVGIRRAKLLVVAISDPDAVPRIIQQAHALNPTIQVIARARYLSEAEPLTEIGTDIVVPEELETAVRLFTLVLEAYLVPKDEIQRQVSAIRSGDYAAFRSGIHEAHLMVLQGLDEDGLHTRAVAVREGAPVAGKTLGELHLRQEHNLTVLAVRRGQQTLGTPDGDFRIQPGDRLILIGLADQFAESAHLFRTPRDTVEVG